MIKYYIYLVSIVLLLSCRLNGQQFVDVKADLWGISEGSARWIDSDRDGDLDVLLMGEHFKGQTRGINTHIYRNLRHEKFSRYAPGIPDLHRGDFDVADYDLDGIEDIAVIGEKRDGTLIATIFKGNGNGQYHPTGISFTPVRDGSIRFGDFDGDGDPDILIAGESKSGLITQIYRNDRKNSFVLIDAGLKGIKRGVAIWYDYNLDGYPDVFVTGADQSGSAFSMLYENTNGRFVALNTGIVSAKHSFAATGDFDNDGDLDIVVLGESGNNIITRLYRNNRSQGFSRMMVSFASVRNGFADWGDFDGDGDVDLLISGESAKGPVSKIYQNNRLSGFSELNDNLIGLSMSTGQWGDYDHDGDLDILIAGLAHDCQYHTKIYRNDLPLVTKTLVSKEEEYEDIFNNSVVVPERAGPTYYYLYSSSYTNLENTKEKSYYLFISPVKKPKKQFEMEDVYNVMIRKKYPEWSQIDQGNIVAVGKSTHAECTSSRQRIIDEYSAKSFKVIEINW
jgi:hypothetical protein